MITSEREVEQQRHPIGVAPAVRLPTLQAHRESHALTCEVAEAKIGEPGKIEEHRQLRVRPVEYEVQLATSTRHPDELFLSDVNVPER